MIKYWLLEDKTAKRLKKFFWLEFKYTRNNVYPDKHYYYHDGENHRTGSRHETAVNPKDLLAHKQAELEKAIDNSMIYLVKEDEINQFLVLNCKFSFFLLFFLH